MKEGYALKAFPEVFKSGQKTTVRYGLVKSRGFETRVEGSRLLPTVPDADRTPQVSRFSLTRADIDRTPGALEDISRVVQQLQIQKRHERRRRARHLADQPGRARHRQRRGPQPVLPPIRAFPTTEVLSGCR